jgi:mRNA-degrading endonuclease RelE of RelBE toxin-antitoxin system
MVYRIEYSPDAVDQLRAIPARDQRVVVSGVSDQLRFQPSTPTRNRKRLRPNDLAAWELRLGRLRVYYNVEDEPEPRVDVLMIGVKDRNIVRIGGKEISI